MRHDLNPYTKLVLAEHCHQQERHVIDLCFLTRFTQSTIYMAEHLGYLRKTDKATFVGTDKLWSEVQAIRQSQRKSSRR